MQLYNQQYLSLAVMQKYFIDPREIVIRKFQRNSNQTKPNNIQIPKMKRKLLFEIEVCLNYYNVVYIPSILNNCALRIKKK